MNEIKILFEVKKIIYRNEKDGYSILNVNLKKHPKNVEVPTAEPIITGYFPAIHIKDEFEGNGVWVDTGSNGYQFNVNTSTLIFPETNKGMVEFLVRFVKGLGKVVSGRIVETFNEDTLNIIINKPEELVKVKGVTEKRANLIHKSIVNHKDYEDVALFLIPLGLSHLEVVAVYERLGYGAIDKIRDNPYLLSTFSNISFYKVDDLARKLGFERNNLERVKQGIMLYIELQMKNKGDMFVFKEEILKNLPAFLDEYGAFETEKNNDKISLKEIKVGLGDLVILRTLDTEVNNDGEECVYISYYRYIENKIVEMVSNLIRDVHCKFCSKSDIDNFIQNYEKKSGITLAKNQKEAVYMALGNRLSILSGGPGTGKTQTINTIINCIKSINPEASIELCAPTGRAAKRMTELTGMKSKTIHRMINLNSFEQDVSELVEIDVDFVIMDEASMVDAYVFYNFLSSISDRTRIIIVGDHEQLPSVGAGLILRDLIYSKIIPTTILNEIFRQAKDSQIVLNSHKVINGVKTTDKDGISFDEDKGDFYFIQNKEIEKINNLILRSIERLIKKGIRFSDIQVLSVMNKGDLGVIELNRKIQAKFNPKRKGLDEVQVGNYRFLRVNDRVMQTINNYDLDVFNGEVGNITSINVNRITDEKDFELIVDFGDKEVSYSIDNIHELTLAYATTVHKSQGSEFPVLIMPFHSSLSLLLNRNIIYTGLTRPKKMVILIGDIMEFNKGIDRIDITIRNSQIKDKLINNSKKTKEII